MLHAHARRVRPDWPTARDRDDDFAHHLALKRRIDRAAHAFIVMKLLAGRGKDEDDTVAILAARRALDVALIRRTLTKLERALDQGDLKPRFERLLRRARRPSS